MIFLHRLDEEKLEDAYWAFDAERKKSGMERDAFKHQMRKFAVDTLDRAGVQRAVALPD